MKNRKVSSVKLAKFNGVLADSTRIEVLRWLAKGDMYVSELLKKVKRGGKAVEETLLSHHLKILKVNKFVLSAREGKRVKYTLLYKGALLAQW